MGIDYLKDNRTTTSVSLGVVLRDRAAEVTASVFGEYKPGSVSQNIALTCVSRGGIERDFMRALQTELGR